MNFFSEEKIFFELLKYSIKRILLWSTGHFTNRGKYDEMRKRSKFDICCRINIDQLILDQRYQHEKKSYYFLNTLYLRVFRPNIPLLP